MQRKWTIALVTMFSFSILVVGISMADDESGPLAKLMETVNKKSVAIRNAVRSPINYKKSQKDIVPNTEELLKLTKEARELSKEALKAKGPNVNEKKWAEHCDAFTKELQSFHALASKPASTQPELKKAFTKVAASCNECHKDFREGADEF